MATGLWSKLGLSAGDPVTNWVVPPQSSATPALSLVDRAGANLNPVLYFNTVADQSRQIAYFTEAPVSDNCEMLVRHQYAVSNDAKDNATQFTFFIDDISSAANAAGFMRVQIYPDNKLRVSSDNPFGNYGSSPGTIASSPLTWEWSRARIEPTATPGVVRVRGRWWAGMFQDEPDSWNLDLTVTPATGVALLGRMGFHSRNLQADHWVDYFSWATEGDTAPGPIGTPANAPGDISLAFNAGALDVSWNAVTDASLYRVQFRRKN